MHLCCSQEMPGRKGAKAPQSLFSLHAVAQPCVSEMHAHNILICVASLLLQTGPPSPQHAGAFGADSLHGSPLRGNGLTPHPAQMGHVRFKLPFQELHPFGEALQGTHLHASSCLAAHDQAQEPDGH